MERRVPAFYLQLYSFVIDKYIMVQVCALVIIIGSPSQMLEKQVNTRAYTTSQSVYLTHSHSRDIMSLLVTSLSSSSY